ncbi:hypothetical protein OROHE_026790 [Orobanche hederae]
MADMRGSGVICDDRCGCPSPCPGGTTCARQAGIVVVILAARWSTSSARVGNTVGATHVPVPRLKSRGQGRPSATAVLVAPVLRALLLNHQPRQQQQ